MPTVISYDSPALMVPLAANVSQGRGEQQQFEDQLQSAAAQRQQQQMADQASARDQQFALQAADLAQRATQHASLHQTAPSPMYQTGGDEGGGGPTIYHPQGESQIPQQAMGAAQQYAQAGMNPALAAQGGGRGRPSGPGMGHMPVNAQQASAQLDQMHEAGQLDDAEYARRKGILVSGGDPFSEPTAGEKHQELQQKYQMETQAQQHAEQLRQQQESEKQRKEDMAQERQGILDQVKVKEARLKDAQLPEADKKMLHTDIDRLGEQLRGLSDRYRRGGQGQSDGQGGQGGQGGGNRTPAKPIPRTLMRQFLQQANFNPQAAQQLASQQGYDVHQIVEDRPDRGMQVGAGQPGTGGAL